MNPVVEAAVTFAGILIASGALALWVDRRLKAAQRAQAEAFTHQAKAEADQVETETTGAEREQASVWYNRWQEAVAAREADRVAHRRALEAIATERATDAAAFRRLLEAETRARGLLETRVGDLEALLRSKGIPLPNGLPKV